MDRITAKLLEDFVTENGLGALPEDKQFEHFAAEIAVSRHYGESVPTPDVVTGEGGDTGIDAIGVLANRALLTGPDETYCRQLIEILSDNDTAQQCFSDCAKIIDAVSVGNLDRDTIRTQSFTENLLLRLKLPRSSVTV